jgi:uncharacterized protein YndB with AHSA1/START domain
MGSFQVRVGIRRPLETVFAVYSDPDHWHWCSFFQNTRWVQGKPWEVESRIRLEADNGSSGSVEHVITLVERNSRLHFITHFAGITLQRR